MKKTKGQKILEQESDEKIRQDKKQKQKKKRKQHHQDSQKQFIQQQQKVQQGSSRIQEGNNKQPQLMTKNDTKQQKLSITDPLSQQLQKLTFTSQLTPSIATCQLINSNLQQLTINLYQTMIMRSSLITSVIQLAKKQLLTPKQYFAIDYTNKLLLIKQLLRENSEVKYSRFVKMIDQEVDRVEGLIIKCMDQVLLFDQVLMDLKKSNVQWEVQHHSQ